MAIKTGKKRASRGVKVGAILALVLGACQPAPYTEAEAAERAAICIARIQTECKPLPNGKKDRACVAYLECRQYADDFEAAQ
jgi:hypothetical protein